MSKYGSKAEISLDNLQKKARVATYNVGQQYSLSGEVFSVKEKENYWGRRGIPTITYGISFKVPDGTKFWFSYPQEDQRDEPIAVGDAISCRATLKGISDDRGMYFLKEVFMEGVVCTHRRLQKGQNGYICTGCAAPATVTGLPESVAP
jgi:hypothetical protein